MKIDLDKIDREQFIVREDTIAGETCYLVFPPHIGTVWNKHNLIFRSSIWNSDGELVSASFPKFFNWGENPDLSYTPFSTTANGGIDVMEKLDGSTLIVSKYKGQLITRTRGTFCASIMENGHEIPMLMQRYSDFFEDLETGADTIDFSYIFEWVSPENVIVLNYPEADISFIGAINHFDYSLLKQVDLDLFADNYGFRRPPRYYYNKIKEMIEDVQGWEGVEGVCVYSQNGQSIRKVKSDWYLALHRMKSELGSFDRVVDAFFAMDMPSYTDFYNQVEEVYDYEIAQRCMPHMSIIADGWKEVIQIVSKMEKFVNNNLLSTVPTSGGFRAVRKEQARRIFESYGNTNRAKYLFKLLDHEELDKEDYKKLLYQCLKQPEEREELIKGKDYTHGKL